jgi:DNA-directed RNA polymerase subunit RPC12/RpoP
MALVKCPECGRENVSDTAEACPNCGYAIKNHYQRVKEEEAKQARLKAENEKRILEEQQKKATEEQRQRDAVAKLEMQIKGNTRTIPVLAILTLLFAVLTVWSWNYSENGDLGFVILFCGFATFFCGIAWIVTIYAKNQAREDLVLVKQSVDSYEKKVEERKVRAAELAKKQQELQDAQHPKCPNCGSKNTKRITVTNRAVSTATLGIASSTIGKQYKCNRCKHMW